MFGQILLLQEIFRENLKILINRIQFKIQIKIYLFEFLQSFVRKSRMQGLNDRRRPPFVLFWLQKQLWIAKRKANLCSSPSSNCARGAHLEGQKSSLSFKYDISNANG